MKPTEFTKNLFKNKEKERQIKIAYKINAPFGVYLETNYDLHKSTIKILKKEGNRWTLDKTQ